MCANINEGEPGDFEALWSCELKLSLWELSGALCSLPKPAGILRGSLERSGVLRDFPGAL